MYQTKQNQYFESSINTASPEKLLIMLYDGAIRFCKMGIAGVQENNVKQANENFQKAQRIIRHLMTTMDPKASFAPDLNRLYQFFIDQLVEANISKDSKPAEEVLPIIMELRETMIEAAKIAAASKKTKVNSYG